MATFALFKAAQCSSSPAQGIRQACEATQWSLGWYNMLEVRRSKSQVLHQLNYQRIHSNVSLIRKPDVPRILGQHARTSARLAKVRTCDLVVMLNSCVIMALTIVW